MDGVEVYALAAERSRATVERFVEAFGPVAAPGAGPFPWPQFDADPARRFASLPALLDFLDDRAEAEYALYWPAAGRPTWPRPLMAFFTADGALVLGAVVSPAAVDDTLAAFARGFGARFGRLDTLLPPESLAPDFVAACRTSTGPRLVDGERLGGAAMSAG